MFDNAYFVSNPQIHQHSWDIFDDTGRSQAIFLALESLFFLLGKFPSFDRDRAARFKPILMAFPSSSSLHIPN